MTTAKLKKRVVRKCAKRPALRKFYLSLTKDARYDFLVAAQTTAAYVQQIYGGWCAASAAVALRIERATAGKVAAWQIRPGLYEKPATSASDAI